MEEKDSEISGPCEEFRICFCGEVPSGSVAWYCIDVSEKTESSTKELNPFSETEHFPSVYYAFLKGCIYSLGGHRSGRTLLNDVWIQDIKSLDSFAARGEEKLKEPEKPQKRLKLKEPEKPQERLKLRELKFGKPKDPEKPQEPERSFSYRKLKEPNPEKFDILRAIEMGTADAEVKKAAADAAEKKKAKAAAIEAVIAANIAAEKAAMEAMFAPPDSFSYRKLKEPNPEKFDILRAIKMGTADAEVKKAAADAAEKKKAKAAAIEAAIAADIAAEKAAMEAMFAPPDSFSYRKLKEPNPEKFDILRAIEMGTADAEVKKAAADAAEKKKAKAAAIEADIAAEKAAAEAAMEAMFAPPDSFSYRKLKEPNPEKFDILRAIEMGTADAEVKKAAADAAEKKKAKAAAIEADIAAEKAAAEAAMEAMFAPPDSFSYRKLKEPNPEKFDILRAIEMGTADAEVKKAAADAAEKKKAKAADIAAEKAAMEAAFAAAEKAAAVDTLPDFLCLEPEFLTEPLGLRWIRGPPMTFARCNPHTMVVDQKLYVLGGFEPNQSQAAGWIEVFDPVVGEWEVLPSPPDQIHSSVMISGLLKAKKEIIIAKQLWDRDPMSFYSYNIMTRCWNQLVPHESEASVHLPPNAGRAVTVGNTLYWISTEEHNHECIILAYDLDRNMWFEDHLNTATIFGRREHFSSIYSSRPGFLHLRDQKFCLLLQSSITKDDPESSIEYLYCVILDISPIYEHEDRGKFELTIVSFQKYSMDRYINFLDCMLEDRVSGVKSVDRRGQSTSTNISIQEMVERSK